METTEGAKKERWEALDLFRGMAVFFLIIFNGFYGFAHVPWWTQHANGNGYLFADEIAPMFLFAVGLSYPLSLKKRKKDGTRSAIMHSLRRGLVLIAFGTLGTLLCFRDVKLHWGVLEMIGGCVIFCLPIILYANPYQRIAIALGLQAGWFLTCACSPPFQSSIAQFVMGGPIAIISWSPIVIIGSALSEIFGTESLRQNFRPLRLLIAEYTIIGFSLWQLGFPPNKSLINTSYIAASIALSLCLFTACIRLERFPFLKTILVPFGKNPLLLYMFSGILNQLMQLFVPVELPLRQLLPYSILEILLSSAFIFWLHKKNLVIAL